MLLGPRSLARSERSSVYHRKAKRVTLEKAPALASVVFLTFFPLARSAAVAAGITAPLTARLNSGRRRGLLAAWEHQRLPSASMPAWLSALTPSPEESRRNNTILQVPSREGHRGEEVEREMGERKRQGKGGGRGREGIRYKNGGCDLLFSSNSGPREILPKCEEFVLLILFRTCLP